MTSSTNAGNQTLVLISGGNGITLIPTGTPLKRLNYFDGQFLRAADLQAEQEYLRRLVALSNQAGGAGVVHGFDLEADGEAVTLKPGLAIDPQGRVLLLPQDKTVSVTELIERSAEIARTARSRAAGRTGGFDECDVLRETPPTAVAERSWYLVTIAHAEALCGEDYVYGKLCEEACTTGTDRPNRLEGVVLRAHPLVLDTALPTSTAESLTCTHLRSCIASAFYADEARRLGSLISGAGLRSDVWCHGATPFGGNEVALAVLVHDGSGKFFLDQWIARRERIDAPPKRHWQWRMAMRPWDVYLAQILQFQCQLHDAFKRQPVRRDEDDPCNRARTLVGEAVQHFDRLAAYYRETTAQLAGLARETRERVLVSPAELKQFDAFRDRLVAAKNTFAFLPENRLLIRRGIVEVPSAGYLPVVPGDTLTVNAQVRRLLGEGVDLRFCIVRPDFVPHALEEAQHMERISLLEGLDHADRKPKVDVLVPDGRIAPGRDETGRYYAMRLHLLPSNFVPIAISVVLARRMSKAPGGAAVSAKSYTDITRAIGLQGGLVAREGETFRYEGVARADRQSGGGIAFHYAGFSDQFELETGRPVPAPEPPPSPAPEAPPSPAPAPAAGAAPEIVRAIAERMREATAASLPDETEKRGPHIGIEDLLLARMAAARRFWVAEKETVRDVNSAVWASMSLAADPATLATGGQTRAHAEVIVLVVQPVARSPVARMRETYDLPSALALVLQASFSGDLRVEDVESRTAGGDETVRVSGALSGDLVLTMTVDGEDHSLTLQVADSVQITRVLAPHGYRYAIELDAAAALGPLVDALDVDRTWTSPEDADLRGNVRCRLPAADDLGSFAKRRASSYMMMSEGVRFDAVSPDTVRGKVQSRQLFRAWQTLNAAVAEPQHPAHERAIRALRAIGKALGNSRFADVKAALLFPAVKKQPEAAILATRDWVLFHRRRDKVCQTVVPTPEVRTRRYAVYQADVKAQKELDTLQRAVVANETAVIRRFEPRFMQIVEFAGGVQSVLSPHAQVRATWRQGVGESAGGIVGGVIASRGLAVAEGKALARERLDALADVLDVEFDVSQKPDYLVAERVPDAFQQPDADGVIVFATHAEVAGNCHEVYAVPDTSEMYMIVEEAGVARLAAALQNAKGIVSLGKVGFTGTVPVATELAAAVGRWPANFGAPTEARAISFVGEPAAVRASYLAQSAQIFTAVRGTGQPGVAGSKAPMPACPAVTVIAGTVVTLRVLLIQSPVFQHGTEVTPSAIAPLLASFRNNAPGVGELERFVASLQGRAKNVTLLAQAGTGSDGAEQRLQAALDALAKRPGQPAIPAADQVIRRLTPGQWADVKSNLGGLGDYDEVIGFGV
jgi:hypothetical protein